MARLILIATFAAGLFIALPAQGQGTPPDDPTPADPIPLDGGIALLAAAGAGYALHRLRRNDSGEESKA